MAASERSNGRAPVRGASSGAKRRVFTRSCTRFAPCGPTAVLRQKCPADGGKATRVLIAGQRLGHDGAHSGSREIGDADNSVELGAANGQFTTRSRGAHARHDGGVRENRRSPCVASADDLPRASRHDPPGGHAKFVNDLVDDDGRCGDRRGTRQGLGEDLRRSSASSPIAACSRTRPPASTRPAGTSERQGEREVDDRDRPPLYRR